MGLDIRKPIAYLFVILGALVLAQGLLSPPVATDAVHAININLWWGVVMVGFGGLMYWLSRRLPTS